MTSILTASTESRVNTYTTNTQAAPRVVTLADGSYFISWTSIGQDGSGFGIYGQHYDANGHKTGSEIHLGTSTTGDQLLTGAMATPDGGYIVLWMDGNGGQDDTYMQRYDASGATVMPQTLVNTTTAGDQWWGHAAYLENNDFVVTWQTNSGLVMQLFDDDGGKIGGEIAINQTPGYKAFGGVVALTNGGFVVTWESDNQDGSGAGVYMRQFDYTGQAVTNDLLVNTYTDNSQSDPKIAVLADGSYVVTWDSYGENGYGAGIYAQHFSYNGKVGPEFEVSLGNPLDHAYPEITALDDGGYVIVWTEGIGTQNIWAQRYDADDHAVGGEMLAGSNVSSGSDQIAISGLPGGGFVVSWTSENISGNEEVYQKVFAPATTLNGTQYLYGTPDSDTLDGGAGGDWMYGGQGDDVYYVNSASDHVGENVNEGTDEVRSTVTWTLDANVENLTLLGTSALGGSGNELGNILTGNAADNSLSGNAGNDTLYGGDGNDTIDTGTGVDSAFGGNGNDIIYGMASSSGTFDGGAGDDTIFGTSGADTITGGDGNDTIHAGGGTAHIDGGAGSDTIFVSDGLSFISGGDGFDTIDASRLGVTNLLVDLASGLMTADGTLGYITGIEFVVGTGYGDTLMGDAFGNSLSGGMGDDIIDGGAGNIRDTLQGGGENDTVSYASSTAAVTVSLAMQDTDQNTVGAGVDYLSGFRNLTGSAYNDTLTGDNGNNKLDGGAGADVMKGGLGDDTYVVGNAYDNVGERLNEGTDTVLSSITYTLPSNVENLTLTGTADINAIGNSINNTIYGNIGNNLLDGGAGADKMYGGLGNDTYVVNNSFDQANENANEGIDTVQSSITFTIGNNVENLTLTGTTAINGTGNALDNIITGNSGNNILKGGAGADTFVFGKFGAGNGLDHLNDFVTAIDHLSFTGADYGIAAGHHLTNAELSLTGVATSAAGVGQFVYNATTHTLSWDSNGVTAGGMTDIVVFDNGATPAIGDFLFT